MRTFITAALSLVLLYGCAAGAPATPTTGPTETPAMTPSPVPSPSASPSPPPSPSPTLLPTQSPTPSAIPSASPSPQAGRFSIDLYRKGAFVSELVPYYCLPAAMQVMINMMKDGPVDTTRETQDRLYDLARTFLIEPYVGKTGAQPEGWAAGLNAEGWGPYEMAIIPTMEEAIHLAAHQLRVTNKPVGLLVWRGAHSWAMSGFESDIDPLISDDFTVSGIYVEDVWYPRISSIWGPSDPPDTLVAMERLPIDYRKYRRPREVHPDKDGQYVLIVPTSAGDGV